MDKCNVGEKMRKISLIIVILLVVCLVGCANHKNNDDINVYDYYSGEQRESTDSDIIYLWNKGNMPMVTNYTENNANYFDEPDFEPYMTIYNVPEGTKVKGAMLVSPGGAFMFRSENTEGKEVAEAFAKEGYISFVVHYRVRPYTERESGIDIARAIKIVRSKSKEYGINEEKIAVVGFSAGGIANGRAVLEFGGKINASLLDSNYIADKIDETSSMPNAVIMGYSFYGRLSVADLNESTFKDFDLPPTYYVYGTEDPFYNQFNAQVDLLNNLNKNIESKVLNKYPHGFGVRGDCVSLIDDWLDKFYK